MSLRDTINGAREEAKEANAPLAKKGEKNEDANADDDAERTGFTKRSVTRAKPTREAAAGVRVVAAGSTSGGGRKSASKVTGKSEAEMTKEEKKAYRAERRNEQDRRTSASTVLLKQTPGYKRSQRIWWTLLGTGFGCTIVSWLLPTVFPDLVGDGTTPVGIFDMILLVLAYVLIIWAFVYDWRVVRPMRKAADATVNSMTNKKVGRVLRGEANEIAREQAEAAEAKAAKKAARNKRHEQHK